MLDRLSPTYSCIIFDRRETGESGGRIEPITWAQYVAQGKGLFDHLNIRRAHLMGGCMGCAPVLAFGVAHPEMTRSMVLYWPVGGAKYRISSHQRLTEHLEYVRQHGLAAVVSLVRKDGKPFGADPRGGPWASALEARPGAGRCVRRHGRRSIHADRHRLGALAFRSGHRAGGRAGGSAGPRYPRVYRARPGRLACHVGGAIPRGMPTARRVLGRAGRGSNGRYRACPPAGLPRSALTQLLARGGFTTSFRVAAVRTRSEVCETGSTRAGRAACPRCSPSSSRRRASASTVAAGPASPRGPHRRSLRHTRSARLSSRACHCRPRR